MAERLAVIRKSRHQPLHGVRPVLLGITGCIVLAVAAILATPFIRARPAAVSAPRTALPLRGRWIPTSLRADVTSLLLMPGRPMTLLAATTNGVWHSMDAGVTWTQDGAGMRGRAVFGLAGTANGTTVWAGGFDGVVYMRDATGTGVIWRRISPVLLTDPSLGPVPIYSLAASPLKGYPLLVGSMGAIFRGDPAAAGRMWNWKRIWQWQEAANPGSGNPPGCFGQCASSGGSSDAGSGGGAVTSLLVAPWDQHTIFASLFEANPPVLVSHNDGESWASYAANLPTSLPVQDLAAGDPHTHQIFLTTMGGGVWQCEAGGAWQDISAGLPQRHAMPLLAAQPLSSGVLYAGTMASGAFEKVGNGPWRPLGGGLTGPAATVLSLVETPGARPVLLAATTSGVYRYVPGK